MVNDDVLAMIGDEAWATELGKFNIELAGDPEVLTGGVFTALQSSVNRVLRQVADVVEPTGTRLAMIGILPSLREQELSEETISINPRFHLLNDEILAARGEEIRILIEGSDRLLTYVDSIIAEAACTSFQCHLQVSPDTFASYWNAAEAIAGIQVAAGANSPYFFGHQLWNETRITLFEQATDSRPEELREQGVRPRVWFGDRWVTSVFDLFEENLRYFPALLPLSEDEDPVAVLERGEAPQLAELTLHNGTVYRWNRPVYAVVNGKPHLRVENRVLPAGPTVVDSIANAAFYYGLVGELAEVERPVWSQMSFSAAASNLVAGAKYGLDAEVYWPGVGMVPVAELILRRLLPMAARGLARWRVDAADASRLLSIIERRCVTGQNGAAWQVNSVRRLQARGVERDEALRLMTQDYLELMSVGEPVHSWPVM
ncbi:MAG TPA: glutamate--cysteine ligase [Streptosporangiaceae bacterium]|nr:glutamate--cysteine ligase [Streptosporangiaceae bacterium]